MEQFLYEEIICRSQCPILLYMNVGKEKGSKLLTSFLFFHPLIDQIMIIIIINQSNDWPVAFWIVAFLISAKKNTDFFSLSYDNILTDIINDLHKKNDTFQFFQFQIP